MRVIRLPGGRRFHSPPPHKRRPIRETRIFDINHASFANMIQSPRWFHEPLAR
jgi:hypothetical protein